jgi:hypothetical protein
MLRNSLRGFFLYGVFTTFTIPPKYLVGEEGLAPSVSGFHCFEVTLYITTTLFGGGGWNCTNF